MPGIKNPDVIPLLRWRRDESLLPSSGQSLDDFQRQKAFAMAQDKMNNDPLLQGELAKLRGPDLTSRLVKEAIVSAARGAQLGRRNRAGSFLSGPTAYVNQGQPKTLLGV